MARYAPRPSAHADIQAVAKPGVKKVADAILVDAKQNVIDMKAVDTGRLHDSGVVEESGDGYSVGFPVEYAVYVHEGESTSKKYGPRPFLSQAAYKDRGRIE